MPTIRMLKSGKWNAQVRISGRKSRSNTFESESEARSWANRTERELKHVAPLKTKQNGNTWKDLALQYASEMLMGKPSQKQFLYKVGRISRHPSMRGLIGDITSQDINQYKSSRLKIATSTTVHNELVTISRVFRWADREAQANGNPRIPNPCSLITLPKPRKPRDRVVERYELDKLLAALPPQMQPIVEIAYETAMRRSEIVKLRAKHLHLEQRLLSVINGKEGDRSVPLSSRAVELFQEALINAHSPDSRLFPVAPHSVTTAFRRARELAGLSNDIRFHQLRHTRCTIVARKGFNQAQMMVVTGHKDIRSVQRYTHLNAADVVNLLD